MTPPHALPPAPATETPTGWTHRFAGLGREFYTELRPTPLPTPYWVGRNPALARELGLDDAWMASDQALQAFTGNQLLPGMRPLASVYSGHQFGQWAGQLGDGRAILLGELASTDGPQEIQLKGAGRTPYSRGGDGRAVLRSSIREFLCSEAMHGLGIPTSRALCVTGSDQPVRREEIETAAVVTRVAPSFIRFGHFEHFSHSGQHEQLRALADFVIDHFYPDCRALPGNAYANLLEAVGGRTAEMVAQWQAVGFCHGVMNTDNMSILGLTIDYGPFQFLDAYNPRHICNHSDSAGRYRYMRQPGIAHWNLFCLGQALLPLMDDQQQALDALEPYKALFPAALQRRMGAKLGLDNVMAGDEALTEQLMALMAQDAVDFTLFWRRLSHAVAGFADPDARAAAASAAIEPVRDLFLQREAFDAWALQWRGRLQSQPGFDARLTQVLMLSTNPQLVLRNHLGEIAIQRAREGDFTALQRLQTALETPFTELPGHDDLAGFPPDWAAHIEISCSS
ncbi:MAG: YdiU family protein [Hydrogenophaga sp.]|uniref:protein adenylyltransferase SelO n=1 Tax=Hydrogenophaga sp. TaxID=1904254 RepID=UPI00272F81A1|nr:YdiU family protein [Hydrogenophaga sp.]MDP2407148.1 YdiU family protein [Hydrogenophaga sp.]MDZ4173977.1 YdiU family protein [Hydrogenophaga sp.]